MRGVGTIVKHVAHNVNRVRSASNDRVQLMHYSRRAFVALMCKALSQPQSSSLILFLSN